MTKLQHNRQAYETAKGIIQPALTVLAAQRQTIHEHIAANNVKLEIGANDHKSTATTSTERNVTIKIDKNLHCDVAAQRASNKIGNNDPKPLELTKLPVVDENKMGQQAAENHMKLTFERSCVAGNTYGTFSAIGSASAQGTIVDLNPTTGSPTKTTASAKLAKKEIQLYENDNRGKACLAANAAATKDTNPEGYIAKTVCQAIKHTLEVKTMPELSGQALSQEPTTQAIANACLPQFSASSGDTTPAALKKLKYYLED
uniref:Variant surface glycoprotein 1125.3021 n=1 Tax=Trypanosoma brucei TaxID=5691 RepID=A0A1J0R9A5_9TRYP|nr:variant surface glycoprotein 1125.3021 [Trypanosoma brucei]